jgi:hypothetical protein
MTIKSKPSNKTHRSEDIEQSGQQSPDEWDWENNRQRWVKHRSQYIRRTTDFDNTDAEVIAWAELGYSHNDIAQKIDISRSATKSRMDRVDEAFDCDCDSALWTRYPESIAVQSPVGIDGTVWGGDGE